MSDVVWQVHFIDTRREVGHRHPQEGAVAVTQWPVICALDILEYVAGGGHDVTTIVEHVTCADCKALLNDLASAMGAESSADGPYVHTFTIGPSEAETLLAELLTAYESDLESEYGDIWRERVNGIEVAGRVRAYLGLEPYPEEAQP